MPVLPLPIAVVQSSLRALLVPAVGDAALLKPSPIAAGNAAVALPAVAMRTQKKGREAALKQANPVPENRFPMSRHARPQGGAGQRQRLRGTLRPSCCGDLIKVALPEPRRSNGGVPLLFPPFQLTLKLF